MTPDPADLPADTTPPYDPSAVARARDALDAVPEKIGRYRVLERLGGGGMGEVYRAEQRTPVRREVAIKLIKLGMDTKLVIARFEAERQALAMMDHPNIAKVHDADADDTGRPYFVMEYVKGKPITDYADANHLTIHERLAVFEQVCHAVQHAHHKGIIHRDLKPSNVLVSTQDGRPLAKVIDFGIAKATNQQLTDKTLYTLHDQFIGTPQYMSPEQADGSLDIDTRTDVYSLGVLLYELLTGSTPFSVDELKAAAFEKMKQLIREIDPPKPSTRLGLSTTTLPTLAASRRVEPKKLGTIVRGELDWIVMKALEKDRARRYDTPTVLAQDLQRFLDGTQVLAAPPTWRYRASKIVRRYRVPIIAVFTLFLALTAGIIGTSYGMRKAILARRAEEARHELEQRTKDQAAAAKEAGELDEYITNLAYAQSGIQSQNWQEVHRRLEACPIDKRGWEWEFLSDEAKPFSGRISVPRFGSLSLSPDGQKLLVIPESDSRGADKLAYLWDTSKNQLLGPPLVHEHAVSGTFAWSTSGDRLLTHDNQDSVYRSRLWDTETGKQVSTVTHSHEHHVELSPDGRRAWRQCNTNGDLWDMDSPTENKLGQTIQVGENSAQFDNDNAKFSDNSKTLCVAMPHQLLLISAETGEQISKIDDSVASGNLTLNKGGTLLLTAAGQSAQVYDTRTGQLIGKLSFPEQPHTILFSSDGTHILCITTSAFYICDALPRPRISQTVDLSELIPMTVSTRRGFNPDGTRLIIAVSQNEAVLIDTATKTVLGPTLEYKDGLPWFDKSGEYLQAIDSWGAFRFWDKQGRTVSVLRPAPGQESVLPFFLDDAPHFNFQDKHALLGARGSVVSANFAGPDSPREIINERLAAALFAETTVAPIQSRKVPVAVLQNEGDVSIDFGNGDIKSIGSPRMSATACAITPDGKRLVIADGEAVRFWDLATLRELTSFRTLIANVIRLNFSPDGLRLAIHSGSRQVEVWDIRQYGFRQEDRGRRYAETYAARKRIGEMPLRNESYEAAATLISNDAGSTPLQKAFDLEELEWQRSSIREKARARMKDLMDGKGYFTDAVRKPERIQNALLRAEVVQSIKALTLTNGAASNWDRVISNGLPGAEYKFYADKLKNGYTDGPNLYHHLNCMAYAIYRTGDFRQCIAILSRPEAVDPDNKGRSPGERCHMADWAFLAMAHFRLGQIDKSHAALAEFRKMYDEGDDAHKTRYKLLAIEAVSMIEPETLEAFTKDDAELNRFAFQTCDRSDAAREDYQLALFAINLARGLSKNQPSYVNTLAMTQYRLGDFENSLDSFKFAEQLYTKSNSALPATFHWPIRAMAAYRAGNVGDAQKYFKRMLSIQDPPGEGAAADIRDEAIELVDPQRHLVADPLETPRPTTAASSQPSQR